MLVDGGRDDPRVPAADGARRRRRELVHAQAPAPEPRRRRRVRRGRRVREELEGLRPDRRRRAARVDRRGDRGRGAPVRRRPRGLRLQHRRRSRRRSGTPRSRTRRTSTSSSTRTTRTTPTTPTTPTAAARRRRGTRATCTRPATTSPRPGHWTDVRVKERDLPSLFGSVGLPLSRNGARARIEIRPAISGHQFLPLAVPNNVITKVQVRYYDECTSAPTLAQARSRAARRPRTRAASRASGTLWGLPDGERRRRPGARVSRITLPDATAAAARRTCPIGVEVRIASRDEIDFDTNTCAQLLAMQYADCFHRLSQIRIWNDGDADNQVRIGDVHLTGGCGTTAAPTRTSAPCPSRRPTAATAPTSTSTGAAATTATKNVPANFTVRVNGIVAPLAGQPSATRPAESQYSVPAGTLTASPGANTVTVVGRLGGRRHDTSAQLPGQRLPNGGSNPCEYSDSRAGPPDVRRHARARPARSRSCAPRRRPWNGSPTQPGDAYATPAHRRQPGHALPDDRDPHRAEDGRLHDAPPRRPPGEPDAPLRPQLRPGAGVLGLPLRLRALVRGEPLQRRRRSARPNNTASWWNTSTRTCPRDGQWFSYGDQGAGFGVNSSNNPWRCVLTAPGLSTGQVGDDIAVATDNCDNINTNSCQNFDCNYDGDYDELGGDRRRRRRHRGKPDAARLGVPARRQPVHRPVPGEQGPDRGRRRDPRARLRVLLRHGLGRRQLEPGRPLPGHDVRPRRADGPAPAVTMPRAPRGAITGVFVEKVEYEPGPVDATAVCVEGQLTPCRVTLVR